MTGSQLQAILDSLVDVVCAIDRQGTIVYVNQAVLAIWGYRRGEMIGKKVFQFIRQQDQVKSQKALINIPEKKGRAIFTNRLRIKDGSTVQVEWHNTRDKKRKSFLALPN